MSGTHMLELRAEPGRRRRLVGWLMLLAGTAAMFAAAFGTYNDVQDVATKLSAQRALDDSLARDASARALKVSLARSNLEKQLGDAGPWLQVPWQTAFRAMESVPIPGGRLLTMELDAESGKLLGTFTATSLTEGIEYTIRLASKGVLSDVRLLGHAAVTTESSTELAGGAVATTTATLPRQTVRITFQGGWSRPIQPRTIAAAGSARPGSGAASTAIR